MESILMPAQSRFFASPLKAGGLAAPVARLVWGIKVFFVSASIASASLAANAATITSANGFANSGIASQTGTFTATFDATPSISPANDTLSFSNGAQTAYTGLAATVRFNTTGTIDARNGAAYAAASSIPFTAGRSYRFRMVINVATRRYSAFVTPAGGTEQTIASNYAFRNEQAGITSINTFSAAVNAAPGGSLTYTTPTVDGGSSSSSSSVSSSSSSSSSAAGTTINSSNGFVNSAIGNQAGSFSATFDATPSISPVDAVLAFSSGAQSAYSGLAAIVRFNTAGTIDARNGGGYAAVTNIPFSANKTYRFRLAINPASHTYSAYVTPAGSAEQTIAMDYAFRSEQGGIASINNFSAVVSAAPGGSLTYTQPVLSSEPSDNLPPTPPSNLSVSNLTCNSVNLSWNASSDNVGVAFYDIFHDGQLMVSVSGSTLTRTLTLSPGAAWGLYVNARDAAGNVSQASETFSIKVPQCSVDDQPPSVPANLTGSVSGTSSTLNWNASSDNVGVVAYDIYRNSAKIGSTSATNYTDSGLATNTSYQYFVVARDAQSNVSSASNTIALSTGAGCANPICSVVQVTSDNDIPWGLVTLPNGTLIYSRRDAKDIILLDPANGVKTTLGTVPNVQTTDGEGGLLGIAVTPNFPATDPWIYIYHTSPTDNRIVRIKYVNGKLDNSTEQVLLTGIGRNKYHNGGRLRFGPDGKLYATTGDAQNGANAQDLNSLNGKVLRLNSDGSRPADNPFGNYVWSYGHRNPQGLAFDSQGRLWEQEFGNSVMDETNLIVKGGNYGWPNCEGTFSAGGSGCGTAGYIAPKHTYTTAEGSCSGIAIIRDVIYLACQRGTRMYREVISGSSLTNVQQFFNGTYGRLRTAEPSRDGNLWITTTNTGDKDGAPNNSNEKILKVLLGN